MREFIFSAAKSVVTNGPLTLPQRTNLKAFSNPRYKRIHLLKNERSHWLHFSLLALAGLIIAKLYLTTSPMGLVMKIQCPECKAIYAAETLEIPVRGISVRCQKCNSRIFIPRVPVLDAQLCPTCGHIIYTQVEGDTSSTECPNCGGS